MTVRLKKEVYSVCDRVKIIKSGELMEITSLQPLTRQTSLGKENVEH
jgi:ABC-type Na+ transport system ATPase subunit NatA